MKFKDITPTEFICHSSSCCPSVFETDRGSYLIIGKKLNAAAAQEVAGRVGDDEFVVEVPKGMIDKIR